MIFLVKHCQFAWEIVEFQSLKALPIWRFLDNFSLEKSCDRLVHWTVINIGSNRRGNFSLSVELSSFIFLLLYHELWVMIRNVHILWTICVNGLRVRSYILCVHDYSTMVALWFVLLIPNQRIVGSNPTWCMCPKRFCPQLKSSFPKRVKSTFDENWVFSIIVQNYGRASYRVKFRSR